MPTLLQFLSHSYFPATILVGPLIPYNNYIKYIESNVNHWDKCWKLSVGRLLIGLFYLAVYQIGSNYWPIDYLISEQYSSSSFWSKATAMAVVTKVCMCKYLMSWLISEGACIASGVSWDGKTYYSCSNIHVVKFETTPTFGGIIKSFNLKTNDFAFKYIYKRLKFLGNRTVSQALTLTFLAVWHGLETGYFVTFMLEFLIMKMEVEVINKFNSLCAKNVSLNRIMRSFVVQWIIYIFFRIYTIYLLGYSFVPFMLLQFGLWYPVYSQVYFYGHIITISWVIISLFI
jgi:lysophospholipid acyltransferase 5